MAVAKLEKITIFGRMRDLDKVTEICGRSQIFHPEDAKQLYQVNDEFEPMHEPNPYESMIEHLREALALIGEKPTYLPSEDVNSLLHSNCDVETYVSSLAFDIKTIKETRVKYQKMVEEASEEISHLAHFTGQNVMLEEIFQCEYIKVRFGSLPQESYKILQKDYEAHPYISFFPFTSDQNYIWGVYMSPFEYADEVDRVFGRLYFQRVRLQETHGTPEGLVEKLKLDSEKKVQEIAEIDQKIKVLWLKEQGYCNQIYTWLMERSTFFSVRSYALRHHQSFLLSGWVPAKSKKELSTPLERLETVECTCSVPEKNAKLAPPVKLDNWKITKPFEFFIDMYGLPNYNETDPTTFVSILYTLLFGIMFADVGQGVCVALIGYFIMWKKKNIAVGKILVPCGISGAVFGLIFGSFFGFEHTFNPLYHALGFADKPINVLDGDTVINIILASVAIGVVSICISMIINIVTSLKRKRLGRAIVGQNGIAGLIFYLALVVGMVVQLATGVKVLTLPYVICLIILPLLVLFLQEMLGEILEGKPAKPKKIGEYLIQSFFELFESMLSLMSNTVSFLRVGAFVLVHAGMMMMVMILADLIGTPGSIGFLIVIVIGNIFVSVLETLLVCIHVLRLQYYELFSRFYDGDGRAFDPIRVKPE